MQSKQKDVSQAPPDQPVDQLRIEPRIIVQPNQPAPHQHRHDFTPLLWLLVVGVIVAVIVWAVRTTPKS